MPIAHISINTTDISAISKFYEATLAPLGFKVAHSFKEGKVLGFADETGPSFWLHDAPVSATGTHIAFGVKSEADVKAFYDAAIAAGGKDNGAPGLRPHLHPSYYAAFVLDPEGRNIEALYFKLE